MRLVDLTLAIGGSTALWSTFESRGILPHRFESFKAYAEFVGLDLVAAIREFEVLRRTYADALEGVSVIRLDDKEQSVGV